MGNSSQISNLQMELKYLDKLKCYQILSDSGGPPPWGGGRWVDGGGGRYGCVGGVSCTYACTHMHARMHMHVKHAKHGCLHAGGHSQFYTCVCVRVCACACVCVHVGTPPMPPDTPRHPPTHLPPPQSRREPKTPNFNNS